MSHLKSDTSNNIPYQFCPIPYEFFKEEFINDPLMMRLIFFIFKRIRPKSHNVRLKSNGYHDVSLEPFEFIFGRKACSMETGLTEKQIRTRLERMFVLGYLSRQRASSSASSSASSFCEKRASSFSVYRVVTEAFNKNEGQQFLSEKGQQNGQQFGHKLEEQEELEVVSLFKKETSKKENVDKSVTPLPPAGGVVVPLSFSHEEKKEQASAEDIEVILWSLSESLQVHDATPKTIKIWIEKYSLQRIVNAILMLKKKPEKVPSKMGWLYTCLEEKWDIIEQNKIRNREFFIHFKEDNHLRSLQIFQTIARDKGRDFEFDFKLEPNELQEYAKRKYGI